MLKILFYTSHWLSWCGQCCSNFFRNSPSHFWSSGSKFDFKVLVVEIVASMFLPLCSTLTEHCYIQCCGLPKFYFHKPLTTAQCCLINALYIMLPFHWFKSRFSFYIRARVTAKATGTPPKGPAHRQRGLANDSGIGVSGRNVERGAGKKDRRIGNGDVPYVRENKESKTLKLKIAENA